MRCDSTPVLQRYRVDGLPALLLALALLPAGVSADSKNNYLVPERTLPTPYGLRIVHSKDHRAADPSGEPAAGMSMGLYPELDEAALPVAGVSLGRYLESIEAAEAAGGAYSADLAEPLAGIGQAYQAEDKHTQAMDFFRRALHLSRINEGLYSPSQLPVLEDMINSQMAMGQFERVDRNQQYRFRVRRHLYGTGEPGLLDAISEYGEWQRAAYLEGLGGETYLRLLDMHDLHSREIERLEAAGSYDPALVRHLRERLRTEYLVSQYEGEKEAEFQINISNGMSQQFAVHTNLDMQRFKMIKNNNFRSGRETLQQIVQLLEQQEPTNTLELAKARIALGDWYLWWDWLARALQSYQQAYALLQHDGEPATDPAALFADFVELPEETIFHPGAISPPAARQARALVMFDISRLGRIRDIEILEMDAPDSAAARITLFDMLREIRFRPRVSKGEVVAVDSVQREYRFQY